MASYLFQTPEFGVSEKGIHLLRSGFEYKAIQWNQVNAVSIGRGNELQNRWIIFLLGMALLCVGGYLTFRTIDILATKEHAGRYVKMLLFFLIPCLGGYFVFNSLKTGTILNITYASGKNDKFSLDEIIKANKLENLRSLLREKCSKG